MKRPLNTTGRGGGAASVLRAAAVVCAIALAWTPPFGAAVAQSSTTSLSGVTLSDGAAGETKLLLSFDQVIPPFSIVTNDNERPTLSFASTVRGASASMPSAFRGLLKTIEFNQNGAGLSISLVGTEPMHINATAIAGRAISLSISAAKSGAGNANTTTSGQIPSYVDTKSGEDSFEVVPLKFADVSEVVGLLSAGQSVKSNDNFTPEEPAFGSAGFSQSNTTNGLAQPTFNPNVNDSASTPYGQMVDDSIGIDRRLNAVILRGPPERIARLKAKIAEIDVPLTSVLLETIFVELTETGAHNIGLDFNNAAGQLAVATYGRGNYGNNSSAGGGFSGYGSYALQAAIYAQVQKGEGRIVSRPRISAQSGRSAKIVTGDALPIQTSIALSGINAVSQQVQYVNVGVTLQVAPRVSADGYVTTHVFAEVSSVNGYSQGYPSISQREASTTATVKDGEYFVIGGLTQENHLKTRSRIPGLGDVPLAGELFKLHEERQSKTELYIVVTPHIVRGSESEEARAFTRKM